MRPRQPDPLAPPVGVPLEVYAQVPPELAATGTSAWTRRHRGLDHMPSFIEGPVLDDEGNLYLVDVAWGRILRVDRDRRFSVVATYDGQPNGLALDGDGSLYVADHVRGLLVLRDPAGSPVVDVVLDGHGGEPFKGLNDLTFGPRGELWFTDQGPTGLHDPTGRVFRLEPGGDAEAVLDNVPSPNGIAVEASGRTVYVAVTRDNAVWRVPLLDDGAPWKVGRYVSLSGGTGPDGLLLGPAGTLLVAHIGMGAVWVFDAVGLPVACLQAPEGLATTNVTMAPGSTRVYVTESETGSVLTADLAEHLPPALLEW